MPNEILENIPLPTLDTAHEKAVLVLLNRLADVMPGFPQTERGILNTVKAWAPFISLEPYKAQFPPQVLEFMSDDDRKRATADDGKIPGEWLIQRIIETRRWMPTPVEARAIYSQKFRPADGVAPPLEESDRLRVDQE